MKAILQFKFFSAALLLLLAGLLQAGEAGAQSGAITVKVQGVKSAKGNVMMSLFNQSEGFPDTHQKALQIKQLPAQKGEMTVVFEGIPSGTYAFAVFHDENGDGKLNTNLVGAPKEPWGVSNNVRNTFSAPSFKDASFSHQQKTGITVQVK